MYSKSVAVGLSLMVASSYVIAIHIGQPMGQDRNDPKVIKGRMLRVCILCILQAIILPMILIKLGAYNDFKSVLVSFGLKFQLFDTLKCLLLICLLYIGPLINHFYTIDFHFETFYKDLFAELTLIWGIRDLIFAPISEEFVYRSLVLSIYKPLIGNGESSLTLVKLWTPFLFGIAHIHHGYTLYKVKKIPASMVLFNGAMQLTYTTLFGMLVNNFMLKNNNIWGCIVIHSICNCMGFPDFEPEMHPIAYYILLVLGLIMFYFSL